MSVPIPQQLRAAQAAGVLAGADERIASTPAGGRIELDLSLPQGFDSAAVATLVAMSRRARARDVTLVCVNVPPNLRKLAALYGVDQLLFGN